MAFFVTLWWLFVERVGGAQPRVVAGRRRWRAGLRLALRMLSARSATARFGVSVQPAALKFTFADAQPTPWIQTFWTPGMSEAMSLSETISWAVKDSSLPSPAR